MKDLIRNTLPKQRELPSPGTDTGFFFDVPIAPKTNRHWPPVLYANFQGQRMALPLTIRSFTFTADTSDNWTQYTLDITYYDPSPRMRPESRWVTKTILVQRYEVKPIESSELKCSLRMYINLADLLPPEEVEYWKQKQQQTLQAGPDFEIVEDDEPLTPPTHLLNEHHD